MPWEPAENPSAASSSNWGIPPLGCSALGICSRYNIPGAAMRFSSGIIRAEGACSY